MKRFLLILTLTLIFVGAFGLLASSAGAQTVLIGFPLTVESEIVKAASVVSAFPSTVVTSPRAICPVNSKPFSMVRVISGSRASTERSPESTARETAAALTTSSLESLREARRIDSAPTIPMVPARPSA